MANILIIDDDTAIQSVFSQYLQALGHNIVTATNGKDGIALLNKQPPELIITDIMMPEMDGLELVNYIRNNYPKLPVIAISGGMQMATINFLPFAEKFGACRVFEKPVSLPMLREAVEELLESPPKG